jgi:hypothetical protein
MVATARRADRVLLHNINWDQFERLLADLGESRSARIAYDNGTLEIMTPLPEHEYFKEVIGTAVQDVAEELDLDYESYGSTTWRKRLKMAGLSRITASTFSMKRRCGVGLIWTSPKETHPRTWLWKLTSPANPSTVFPSTLG